MEHNLGGENTVDVASRFLHEKQIQGIANFLNGQLLTDSCLTCIVRGGNSHPIPIFCISSFQIFACCLSRFLHMIPFVNIGVDFQSVISTCSLHKLPKACGSGNRTGNRVDIALDNHQILKVVRDTIPFKDGFDHWEVSIGSFNHLD